MDERIEYWEDVSQKTATTKLDASQKVELTKWSAPAPNTPKPDRRQILNI
jgi:hypothetical protein